MDKIEPPESFGVFKPVGHIVMAFRSTDALQSARAALQEQGFEPAALLHYTSQEMVEQPPVGAPSAAPEPDDKVAAALRR